MDNVPEASTSRYHEALAWAEGRATVVPLLDRKPCPGVQYAHLWGAAPSATDLARFNLFAKDGCDGAGLLLDGPGFRLCVVDIDDETKVDAVLRWLRQRLHVLYIPAVKTGRGLQLYFRCEDRGGYASGDAPMWGTFTKVDGKTASCVDLRGPKTCAILPGSRYAKPGIMPTAYRWAGCLSGADTLQAVTFDQFFKALHVLPHAVWQELTGGQGAGGEGEAWASIDFKDAKWAGVNTASGARQRCPECGNKTLVRSTKYASTMACFHADCRGAAKVRLYAPEGVVAAKGRPSPAPCPPAGEPATPGAVVLDLEVLRREDNEDKTDALAAFQGHEGAGQAREVDRGVDALLGGEPVGLPLGTDEAMKAAATEAMLAYRPQWALSCERAPWRTTALVNGSRSQGVVRHNKMACWNFGCPSCGPTMVDTLRAAMGAWMKNYLRRLVLDHPSQVIRESSTLYSRKDGSLTVATLRLPSEAWEARHRVALRHLEVTTEFVWAKVAPTPAEFHLVCVWGPNSEPREGGTLHELLDTYGGDIRPATADEVDALLGEVFAEVDLAAWREVPVRGQQMLTGPSAMQRAVYALQNFLLGRSGKQEPEGEEQGGGAAKAAPSTDPRRVSLTTWQPGKVNEVVVEAVGGQEVMEREFPHGVEQHVLPVDTVTVIAEAVACGRVVTCAASRAAKNARSTSGKARAKHRQAIEDLMLDALL